MNKKSIAALIMAAIVSFFVPLDAYADNDIPSEVVSAVSQSCSSIKLQLQTVQKNDARMRIHLGQQYETLSNRLMLNLNLRLVKNNIANANLINDQAKFSEERDRFKSNYIAYSQELDALIKIDCKNEPENFYIKLRSVRSKRASVDANVKRLQTLAKEHRKDVVSLLKEYDNGD